MLEELEPPEIFTETEDEELPVLELPLFPPEFELEPILKLMLELLFWLTVQFWLLFILTVLFELLPLPEIITVVPPPEGLGETEGAADGETEGAELGDELGVELGAGLAEGAGLPEALGVGDGLTDGEGLGKLAAAVKVLFNADTLSENSPKTDWFRANIIKHIRNEVKKYVFLIPSLTVPKPSSPFASQFLS